MILPSAIARQKESVQDGVCQLKHKDGTCGKGKIKKKDDTCHFSKAEGDQKVGSNRR